MNSSALVRVIGFPALLIHGDLLVADRWRWLKRRLGKTRNGESVVDVGCGSGAFTIGAARRGYRSVGLSWDERNQRVAQERAGICGVAAEFPIVDVRRLDGFPEFVGAFDAAICFENIEHILDDAKLMTDMARCLKPGGRLLLTAPSLYYEPIFADDMGPFSKVEDGGHVRRGYSTAMLTELCERSGLCVEEFSTCSGFLSQKLSAVMRAIRPNLLGWALVLPLRVLPPLFDRLIGWATGWPDYSICMIAYKPRFEASERA